MHIHRRLALAAVTSVVLVACGSDDDDASPDTSAVASTALGSESTGLATAPATEPASSDPTSGEGGSLTLYSGRNEELVEPLIADFEAATGIDVEVRYGSSAEMGAALMEEGDGTPAEVFFSQEVGALGMLAKADLLSPLPDEVVTAVDERFRPADGNLWVGVTGRSRVIVYNRDLVAEPPAGVAELTDPAYAGQVAIVPGNAGFQAFVTAFRVSQGDDAARQWLTDMQSNGVVTDIESNDDVLTAVETGEIPMGLINHYYWARSLEEAGGAEARAAQLVFPNGEDPGGLVNATAVGITTNGADNPAAAAFVEYLLSVEGQTYFATETYEYPLVDGVADPVGLPALEELQGPPLDLTDLDSLEETQAMLTELGLLELTTDHIASFGADRRRTAPNGGVRPSHRAPRSLSLAAAVAAVAVVVPISYVAVRATDNGWDPFVATLWRPRTLQLVGRSVGLAVAVTAASVVIGVAGAWLVERTDLPGRRVWRVVLGLPLAIPSYVAAWGWIAWRPSLAGGIGAWAVLTSISYPFVYLPVLGALRRVDPAVEEVARSLGRGPWRVLAEVTLPQIRIATVGGALLVGLYALSDFGAVSIMRFEALTHVIYRSYRATFDRTPPAVLGCVLVVISLLVVWPALRLDRRATHTAARPQRDRVAVPLGAARWPVSVALIALMGLTFGVPARTLVLWTYRGRSTTDWGRLVDATVTTLWLGVVAGVVTVIVATPVALLSARFPGRLPRHVTALAYAGHSLPGIVVALAMVFFGIRVATPIYQEWPMLVFAYVVLFLSLALGAIHNAIANVAPSVEEAARSLGRRPWTTWTTITFRLAAPGIGVAAALVALTVMKELPATLLLRPIETDTLATRLWSQTDARSYAAAAPYAAAIVLVAAIPTAVLTQLGRRREAPR